MALVLSGALSARGADSSRAASEAEDTVRLEPVFVEAASLNPWMYFRVPGFEVISHCPDDFNRTYARALDRANAAKLAVLPEDFWGKLATPMKIILYNREPGQGDGFNRAKPIDLSWLAGDEGSPQGPYSIVKSYPTVVGDGDTFINCGNYWSLLSDTKDFYLDPDSEILLRSRTPQLPVWFVAGLVGPGGLLTGRVIEPSIGGGDTVVIPAVVWGSKAATEAILKDPKAPRTVPGLKGFFGEGAAAADPVGWNAEAGLLVRWGLFGREADGSDHREGFLGLVRASCSGPLTEELFRSFLSRDFAQADAELRAYVTAAVSGPVRLPLPADPSGAAEIREATPTEVARIVGDWGRLEGKSVGIQNVAYQRECLEQADRLFERIYARQTSDPDFLAAFGLYALQVGDMKRARETLEDATGAGVVRPRAYVELARIRLRDALPFAEQGIGDLGEKDYQEILRLLRAAERQMPDLLAIYQLRAHAMEHAPATPGLAEMAGLEKAVGLFPRNARLAYKIATLYKRFGYPDAASRVISRSLAVAEDTESRTLLGSFVSRDR